MGSKSNDFYYEKKNEGKKLSKFSPTSSPPKEKKDATDVQQTEKKLLQLMEDFETGKLKAFGKDSRLRQMEEIREQQEKLAKLHFDVGAEQDLYPPISEDGLRISEENMQTLMEKLAQLSDSIEHLHSNTYFDRKTCNVDGKRSNLSSRTTSGEELGSNRSSTNNLHHEKSGPSNGHTNLHHHLKSPVSTHCPKETREQPHLSTNSHDTPTNPGHSTSTSKMGSPFNSNNAYKHENSSAGFQMKMMNNPQELSSNMKNKHNNKEQFT